MKKKFDNVPFTSIMTHLCINRPATIINVPVSGSGGGPPVFMEKKYEPIVFKKGLFTAKEEDTLEFLRNYGDGVTYGFGIQYFEVPKEVINDQERERALRKDPNLDLVERIETLEIKVAGAKKPGRKKTAEPNEGVPNEDVTGGSDTKPKLSDTI